MQKKKKRLSFKFTNRAIVNLILFGIYRQLIPNGAKGNVLQLYEDVVSMDAHMKI